MNKPLLGNQKESEALFSFENSNQERFDLTYQDLLIDNIKEIEDLSKNGIQLKAKEHCFTSFPFQGKEICKTKEDIENLTKFCDKISRSELPGRSNFHKSFAQSHEISVSSANLWLTGCIISWKDACKKKQQEEEDRLLPIEVEPKTLFSFENSNQQHFNLTDEDLLINNIKVTENDEIYPKAQKHCFTSFPLRGKKICNTKEDLGNLTNFCNNLLLPNDIDKLSKFLERKYRIDYNRILFWAQACIDGWRDACKEKSQEELQILVKQENPIKIKLGRRKSVMRLQDEKSVVGYYKNRAGIVVPAIYLENLYHLSSIHQQYTGRGIKISIAESGATDIIVQHEAIKECFESKDCALVIKEEEDTERAEDQTHATAVAGLIATIAPNVFMNGLNEHLFEYPNTTAEREEDILNLSVGFSDKYSVIDDIYFYENTPYLKRRIDNGTLIVKGAGNSGLPVHKDVINFAKSAAQGRMLIVGNVEYQEDGTPFLRKSSNYVPETEENVPFICAPGTDMIAPFADNQYGIFSGTSAATPIVSGALALLMQAFPKWKDTPEKYVELLLETADKEPSLGKKCGYGVLNIEKALAEGKIIYQDLISRTME